MRKVVIASAVRTPIGSFMGSLSQVPAPKLGAVAIKEAVKRVGLRGDQVDEVLMGCVLMAGMGQAPARQAALSAGLPQETPCTTVHKVCGSGLKTVMMGAQAIAAGDADVVVAGGMENMSLAPYLLQKARSGYRLGHGELVDSVVHDGLWDVYNDFHMGNAAELCAKDREIPRSAQDEFARVSYDRAIKAQEEGKFNKELVSVEVPQRKGDPKIVEIDEEPGRVDFAKISQLKPAFEREGTVTAANASKLNDGAAALVLMAEEVAESKDITPLGTLVCQTQAAGAPEWFTTAPATAIARVFERTQLGKGDIDLFEINEAFSVVALAVKDRLGLDLEKINVHGGAVALGHPIGASGARILTTLLYAMEDRQARRGIASLCIGGGEAVAVLVERDSGKA